MAWLVKLSEMLVGVIFFTAQIFAELLLSFLGKVIGVLLLPLDFIRNRVQNWFPPILRPLYRFSLSAILACIAYFGLWVLFSYEPRPEDFVDVTVSGTTYHLVTTGLLFVGMILGFAILDVVFEYIDMFFGWLGKFRVRISVVFTK